MEKLNQIEKEFTLKDTESDKSPNSQMNKILQNKI